MRYKILILVIGIILVITSGCTSNKQDNEKTQSDEEVISDGANQEKKNDDETYEKKESSQELEDEPIEDPLANLIDKAPSLPMNFEEAVNYPTGPLASNGKYHGKEPLMTEEELVDFVTDTLPSIPEDADEEYLDQWFKAYRYLFAENYPNPNQVITTLKMEHFGQPDVIEDERFHFKDQINLLVILDVSGSMANEIDGKPMMDIAKDSINNFVTDLPEEVNVGLRVYGHEGKPTGKTKEESCQSTDLVYDINTLDKQEFFNTVNSFEPTGWTPIGLSLEEAKEDFKDFPGEENTNLVYVVSDGAETCGGDPVQAAKDLAESDIQSIVNVIGFNVDMDGQSHLKEIAESGGGIYAHAGNEEQMNEAFSQAEELLKQWQVWKDNAEQKADVHRLEQRHNVRDFRSNWRRYVTDEDTMMGRVLFDLNEEYLGGSYHYLDDKIDKLWNDLNDYGQDAENYLFEEIEKNHSKLKEKIDDEYNENAEDD